MLPEIDMSREGLRKFIADSIGQGIKPQVKATLFFGAFLGILFFADQIGVTISGPFPKELRWYYFWVLTLVGLAAGCMGWMTGLVLSPLGIQANAAQKILAALSVFWSGVIVGHISEIMKALGGLQTTTMSSISKARLVFGLGIYFLAVCVTFNTRLAAIPATEASAGGTKPEPVPNQ
jgi:hypothetical protein